MSEEHIGNTGTFEPQEGTIKVLRRGVKVRMECRSYPAVCGKSARPDPLMQSPILGTTPGAYRCLFESNIEPSDVSETSPEVLEAPWCRAISYRPPGRRLFRTRR